MASFVACLSPAGLEAPVLLDVSQTQFSVSWRQPKSYGGCSVTSYSLYLSDDQEALSPTYSLLESSIASTTFQKVISIADSSLTGKVLRLKVEAINQMGAVQSPAL